MTKKLSNSERDRVSAILTKCAQETKHIENSAELGDAVFSILSKELGDNPGLFKAACQTYNSCKSIYKLEAADDNTRGNSFSILDVQDMMARLNAKKSVDLRKAASAPAVFKKAETVKPMKKVASAATPIKDTTKKMSMNGIDERTVRGFIKQELDDLDCVLHKTASAVRVANAVLESAVGELSHDLIAMGESDRIKHLSKIAANFGDYGKTLLAIFEENNPRYAVSSKQGFVKYKGTPALGSEAIYKKASAAVDSMKNAETAEAFKQFALLKGADALKSYAKIYGKGIDKRADAGGVIGTTIKADAAKDIADMLSLRSEDAKKIINDIYNAEYMNELIGHSYGRAFMNAAMDESIAKYPLDKLVSAFNAAVAKLPVNTRMTPATMHQSLINSLMINALATGSAPSKADTDTIEALQTAYSRLNMDRGYVEDNNLNKSDK